MKQGRLKAFVYLLSALAFMAICQSAQAQNAQQGGQPVNTRPYSIRYTGEAITTSGWEKVLTDGDPNLKHWHWSPVTDYSQYYKRIPAGSLTNQNKRPSGGIYVKPVHISPEAYAPKRQPQVKPVHVGFNTRSNTSTSANLSYKRPQAAHAPAATTYSSSRADVSARISPGRDLPAKSYGANYTSVSARINPGSTGYNDSRQVHGKLMTQTR